MSTSDETLNSRHHSGHEKRGVDYSTIISGDHGGSYVKRTSTPS